VDSRSVGIGKWPQGKQSKREAIQET